MKLSEAQALVSTPLRRSFSIRAAARETFTPSALIKSWIDDNEGASASEQVEAIQAAITLRDASMPCVDASGGEAFRLRSSQRHSVLRAVGREAVLRVLGEDPEIGGSLTEDLFRDLLVGRAVIDMSDRAKLVAMREAVEWSSALGVEPPVDAQSLTRHLRKFDFLEGLGGRDLHRFVGRENFRERLMSMWREQSHALRIALVEGPGGVGKSLGIARFVADVLESPELTDEPHAVFLLDFDRASLRTATVDSLLQELLRQAAAWVDQSRADEFRSYDRTFSAYDDESVAAGSRGHRLDRNGLVEMLMGALGHRNEARVLVIADSYEQVEGEDDVAARSVRKVAKLLEPYCSRLMLIYASRVFIAPAELNADVRLKLNGLPATEAETYLRNEADRLGVEIAPVEIAKIRRLVGSSPLALRLAARVLEQAGGSIRAEVLEDLVAGSSEMTQALLYDRVLRRLRDNTLRRIALPSLQLRYLTAELIDEVLAGPCGLHPEMETGEEVLRRCLLEPTLFTQVPGTSGQVVRHRADVRSNLLGQVDRSMPLRLRDNINEAAIEFFKGRPALEDQAEALYHRLRLDRPEESFAQVWNPEMLELLRPNMADLPPRARSLLRRQLGTATKAGAVAELSRRERELTRNTIVNDSASEFEIYARKLLQSGDGAQFIVDELEGRQQALRDQLGDLYAAALMQCGYHSRLLELARKYASKIPGKLIRGVGSSVLSIAAGLLEGRGELGPAQQYWIIGLRWADPLDAPSRLGCLIGSIRLRRKLRTGKARRMTEIDSSLALLTSLELGPQQETLVREAAAELGEMLIPASTRHSEDFGTLGRIFGILFESSRAFPSAFEDPARARQIVEQLAGGQGIAIHSLGSLVMRAIYGGDEQTTRRVVDVLRDEVDWILRSAALPKGALHARGHDGLLGRPNFS